jgi:UPF0755 protein
MKKSCLSITLLAIAIAACFGVAYFVLSYIPTRVTETFGSPNPALSPSQRLRYPIELFLHKQELFTPSGGTESEPLDFDIASGEPVSSISARLEEMTLIPDAALFSHLLIYTGLDTSIQSGRFKISKAKSPVEVAVMLADPTAVLIPFSVLPGWRLEEIADSVKTYNFPFTGADFLTAAENPTSIGIEPALEGAVTLEGMIPPGITYVNKVIGLSDFITSILEKSTERITPEIGQAFQARGLTEYQAVILASIVQREAVQESEMGTIASVFLNRLNQGMKLESDPTVQYALGYHTAGGTWWKNPLSLDDLRVNSPYNTYLFGGLPPTPISSPSQEALSAVAFPEQTNFIFFQAKCDGSGYHNFAVTYEEHVSNSCN